jgi:hypothetical protein
MSGAVATNRKYPKKHRSAAKSTARNLWTRKSASEMRQQRRTYALELHFSPFFHPDQGRMIFVVDRQLNVSRDVYLQIKKMFPEIFLSLSIVFKTFCSLRRVLPSRKAALRVLERASFFFQLFFPFNSRAGVASLTCIFASVLPRSLLSARTTCAQ